MICCVRRSDISKQVSQQTRTIHVGARLALTGFDDIQELIREEFTYPNPAFYKATAMHMRGAKYLPKTVNTWKEKRRTTDKKLELSLPRGALSRLLRLLDGQHGLLVWHRASIVEATNACAVTVTLATGEKWSDAWTRLTEAAHTVFVQPECSSVLKGRMNRDLYDHQERVVDALLEHRCGCARSPTGSGKCLGLGTRVMLADGSTRAVEEIQQGDLLMGPDSRPRRVLSTTRGTGQLFRVVPVKGDSWVCNDVHVLTLVHTVTGRVVDVDIPTYLASSKTFRHEHKQFTPETGVEFLSSKLPIDPYFIGVWYGDGTKNIGPRRGVAISKPDVEIRDLCHDIARRWGLLVRTTNSGSGGCPTFHIHGEAGEGNALLVALRQVVGDGMQMPHSYLTASRSDRAALLAGLLDTDGHLCTGCFDIVQKNRGIADGVCFLARSLGKRASLSPKVVEGETYWRVSLSGDFTDIPMRLPRKVPRKRRQKKVATRTGFELWPIGVGEYAGFELDGDGRFLLGDFTVTHNTTAGLACVSAIGGRTLILAHTKALIDEWCRRAKSELGIDANTKIERVKTSPLSVITMQTFTKHAKDLTDVFTLVICDEIQRLAAPSFFSAVDCLDATYKLGLSADERRSDGMHVLTHDLIGPVMVDIPEDEVLETGNTVEVEFRVLRFDTEAPEWLCGARAAFARVNEAKAADMRPSKADKVQAQELLGSNDRVLKLLADDASRERQWLEVIRAELDAGLRVCVMSHRRETAETFMKKLASYRPASVLGGDTSKGVQSMLDGKTKLVVGTFEAVGTGTNMPDLDAGFFLDPCHQDRRNLKQYVGRFCRNSGSDVKPRVYAPWDEGIYGDRPLRRYVQLYPRAVVRSQSSSEFDEYELAKAVLKGNR
jgi:superfamily II DNA or RNA helicase